MYVPRSMAAFLTRHGIIQQYIPICCWQQSFLVLGPIGTYIISRLDRSGNTPYKMWTCHLLRGLRRIQGK
jgi:hypothetical protein